MFGRLSRRAYREGLTVDLRFTTTRPGFGDLFTIVGFENPASPPSGAVDFSAAQALGIDQIDDFFGLRTEVGEGDDVCVWVYPCVGSEPVDHHPGPFDALRLEFDVLRNSVERHEVFLDSVRVLAGALPVEPLYASRRKRLELADLEATLREDLERVVEHWRGRGIEPGGAAALRHPD